MVLNSLQKITRHATFIAEIDSDIPIPQDAGGGVLRANIYRPLDTDEGKRYPVLMTIGPYGKDVPYKDFHPNSFADVPNEQKSEFSAWETPEPTYWTQHGYIVVRIDERGTGQSPGILHAFSAQTATDFKESIEWAASQTWSSGKVGLLGISYYACTQWPVAALKPKGLVCIIPWEGFSDVYRDCARQGGILSNKVHFIQSWYKRQVTSNQYGLPGKAARNWGPDTIECSLSDDELHKNEVHMPDMTLKNKYLDDAYFASKVFDLSDVEVPLLSVANWGGIALHLRGNVMGYMEASSKNKWLYFITGRHDLPFYLPEFVALQKSFLDAWLKGEDDRGWLKGPNAVGGMSAISMPLRAGNPGYNSTEAENTFVRRTESEWPIARTNYVRFYLNADQTLTLDKPTAASRFNYPGLKSDPLQFKTAPFLQDTEVTGHIVAKLIVSVEADNSGKVPRDLDLFVTLRHLDAKGNEIFCTGTTGDPAPICKGWLRASLRAIDASHPRHRAYLPHRPYTSAVVAYPEAGIPFEAVVEIWPTNVVVTAGNQLVFEVSSQNTQGGGWFGSDHPEDRTAEIFGGGNVLFAGGEYDSWVQLPIIPAKPTM